MPTLLTELEARGLLADSTPGLADRLAKGPITGYVGFDPTADSLHVGNLVVVMALVWIQRSGGRPIALVGGGTGLVGDPSGKRAERPMLSNEQVAANVAGIEKQLHRFLDFTGSKAAQVRNNVEWLGQLRLIEFLRDTGKHFTVNYMLQKDSVKSRMDTGISFTEFAYMLVQAHDFAHLCETDGCELQCGGSDQWGNITAGIELAARRLGRQVHGLTLPLLTTSTGAKFGKTEEGTVWLDPAKTSPYKFYQYWLNSDDRDVERFLKTFTVMPLERIDAIVREHHADPSKRAAQRALAVDVTERVHGTDALARVLEASELLFGSRDLRTAEAETLAVVAVEVPTKRLTRDQLTQGVSVVDALVDVGLATSKADARRGIQGQGFSVNGEKIGTPDLELGIKDLLAGRYIALQKGRRNFALIQLD